MHCMYTGRKQKLEKVERKLVDLISNQKLKQQHKKQKMIRMQKIIGMQFVT